MATPSRKPATLADLVARDDHDRLEIIGGEIIEKAMPSPAHAATELELAAAIAPFNRRPGGRDPGGWWLFTEIHVESARGGGRRGAGRAVRCDRASSRGAVRRGR